MFQTLSRLMKRPDPHEPCATHKDESARLRVDSHQLYDQNRELNNDLARLQAENNRLTQANTALSLNQKDSLIQELADRLLTKKARTETPELVLPCTHHREAHISFAA